MGARHGYGSQTSSFARNGTGDSGNRCNPRCTSCGRCRECHAVDRETKLSEESTLEPEDVMATLMLPSPVEKWDKLSSDYATVSAQMATVAKSLFNDFRMRDGDTVVQTQHQ